LSQDKAIQLDIVQILARMIAMVVADMYQVHISNMVGVLHMMEDCTKKGRIAFFYLF
jgi:hypothetical protein